MRFRSLGSSPSGPRARRSARARRGSGLGRVGSVAAWSKLREARDERRPPTLGASSSSAGWPTGCSISFLMTGRNPASPDVVIPAAIALRARHSAAVERMQQDRADVRVAARGEQPERVELAARRPRTSASPGASRPRRPGRRGGGARASRAARARPVVLRLDLAELVGGRGDPVLRDQVEGLGRESRRPWDRARR